MKVVIFSTLSPHRRTKKAARRQERLAILSAMKKKKKQEQEEEEDDDDDDDDDDGKEEEEKEEASGQADRDESDLKVSNDAKEGGEPTSPRRMTKREKKREERRIQVQGTLMMAKKNFLFLYLT